MAITKKIHHVAIAVQDLDAALKTFTGNFGFPVTQSGEVPQLNVRRAFLTIGDAALELIQPTSEKNPATKFLTDRGEGMYLLSLEVADLAAAARQLEQKGIRVAVQALEGGIKLGFISPKLTHGVLLQLIENSNTK
jgi:methylmalonyl-CoA epimerase